MLHGDAHRPEFRGERPGHAGQPMLARHVGGDVFAADDRESRAHIDDPAIDLGDHHAGRLAAQDVVGPHIRRDHPVPCRRFCFRQRLPGVDARVVDEDVEAALRGSPISRDGGHACIVSARSKARFERRARRLAKRGGRFSNWSCPRAVM